MSVSLSPIGGAGAQFFDNNGNPLSGGKLYSYEAGTTTPKTTYTTAAGTTANSNPIILNAAGRPPQEIWLTTNEPYKFVLNDSADNLIGTWDNIYGYSSGSIAYAATEVQTATAGQTLFVLTEMIYNPGTNTLAVYVDGVNQVVNNAYIESSATEVTFVSGLHEGAVVKFVNVAIVSTDATSVTYEPGFAGSVQTTVAAKLQQTVSVKDFGAAGDGVTDDTAAIQAAIDSCFTTGQSVYVNAGTYAVTGIKVYPNTILDFDANAELLMTDDGFCIRTSTSPSVTIPNNSVNKVCINNAKIDMNDKSGVGIFFEGAQFCQINGAYIKGVGDTTFTYDDGVASSALYRSSAIALKGIYAVAGAYYNNISNCRCQEASQGTNNSGIWMGSTIGQNNQRANFNQINLCQFINYGEGISLYLGGDNRIVQPDVSLSKSGIVIGNPTLYTIACNGTHIYQSYLENNTTVGINLTTRSNNTTIFGLASTSGTSTILTDDGFATYVAELRVTPLQNTPISYLGGFKMPNSGSSDPLVFDWYEKGTFTPEVADASTGGNVATASNVYGFYTRIGNMVFVNISMENINTTGLTGANLCYIRGLPFDINSSTQFRTAGAVSWNQITSSAGSITVRGISGSDHILLEDNQASGITNNVTISQIVSGSAYLFININYPV